MARIQFEFYSKSLLRRFKASLIIPSLNLQQSMMNNDEHYYENRTETFPLMLLLNGFGDNEQAFLLNTNIDELCETYKVAALFINGENKRYLNLGGIDNYYDLIEKDLLDYVYGNFKNLSRNKPLIIGGVSMGGYGSLYHYLTNINKYSACFALSPATKLDFIDETKYGTLKDLFLKNKESKLNVYLSIGTNDFIINESREFNKFLEENQVGVSYKFVEGYPHAWSLWRIEIIEVFNYFKNLGLIGQNPNNK